MWLIRRGSFMRATFLDGVVGLLFAAVHSLDAALCVRCAWPDGWLLHCQLAASAQQGWPHVGSAPAGPCMPAYSSGLGLHFVHHLRRGRKGEK